MNILYNRLAQFSFDVAKIFLGMLVITQFIPGQVFLFSRFLLGIIGTVASVGAGVWLTLMLRR